MPESLTLATNAGTTFTIIGGTGIALVEHSYPAPKPKLTTASSIDTEGTFLGPRAYENRQINLTVECFGATSETVLKNLEAHVAQIGREGGTLTWVTPAGATIIFDLLTWDEYEPTFDIAFSTAKVSRVRISFQAKPFGRGTPVTLTDRVETTLPWLVFTETSIPGDVPALGKLVIDEDQAQDQAWVIWGQQQRDYSAAASAALGFQAEALTAQGGSATAVGASGASGAGSNVMRNTDLTTSFVSILSGQLSGGGAYLSHVGTFRVFARAYCPTSNGDVEVALEWAEGDFRRITRNAVQTFVSAWGGSFRLLDLGTVSLTAVDTGTQRWEPRIIARSASNNVGAEIDLDYLLFIPCDEGAGEVSAVFQVPTPTSFSARDEFNQTAGALNAKVLPAGGSWATSGAATDFTVSGSGDVTRATNADASSRFAVAGVTNYTNIVVQCDITHSSLTNESGVAVSGVFARWTDANNHLSVRLDNGSFTTGELSLFVQKVVAGVSTNLANVVQLPQLVAGTAHTLRVRASATGEWQVSVGASGGAPSVVAEGQDAVLATGGTLATGEPGLVDAAAGMPSVVTRTYDNFAAWVPQTDAAVFASQSLTIHHDKVRREDSGGTLSVRPSSYEGDYLLVPPTGPDARTNRFIVKASRGVPGEGADSGIDDISCKLTITPRFLVVPS